MPNKKTRNYGNKRNGGKFNPKQGKTENDRMESHSNKTEGIPCRNDYRFYAASEQIAKDIASLPFNYMSGTNFPVQAKAFKPTSNEGTVVDGGQLPAIGVVRFANSIGHATKQTDGINMATVQLYTKVRQANSGARNYEAADLMMYVLAMRDIYSAFFELKRKLGTLGLFNYYNHNIPDLLLAASGLDAQDMRDNMAQYRGRLNLIARKINSFAVPKYFKVFARSAFISSYIFSDSSSIRSQMYIFDRANRYRWSGTEYETGTALVSIMNEGALNFQHKFKDELDDIEKQLDALFLDDDALTMSGDVLKAFGESGLYTIAETPENYVTEVVFDEDVLAQIENAQFLCTEGVDANENALVEYPFVDDNDFNTLDVVQEGTLIKWAPRWRKSVTDTTYVPDITKMALNSHKDNPDYKDVLEWSRLMATTQDATYVENPDSNRLGLERIVLSCGLELPLELIVVRYNGSEVEAVRVQQRYGVKGATYNALDTLRSSIFAISHFDWHPFLYVLTDDGTGVPNDIKLIGDIKVATTVDRDTMGQINDAACYGAFYDA